MSARTNKATGKQAVPPAIVAIVVVLLVVFVAWRAYRAFAGPAVMVHPPVTAQMQQDQAYVSQKAREARGDFARLSPADQAKVQQLTHGFGAPAIASAYRKQQGQ